MLQMACEQGPMRTGTLHIPWISDPEPSGVQLPRADRQLGQPGRPRKREGERERGQER